MTRIVDDELLLICNFPSETQMSMPNYIGTYIVVGTR